MARLKKDLRGKDIGGIIDSFRKVRVLVVGDLMLDEFIRGRVSRISPEAPVPVVDVIREDSVPGGAANVAGNIVSLGGRCYISGIIGSDSDGADLIRLLRARKIDTTGVISVKGRRTTVKTRVVAHSQQVVRVDREDRTPAGDLYLSKMIEHAARLADRIDAVVVSDYAKGVVTKGVMAGLAALCRKKGLPLLVDPKVKNMSVYKGAYMVTPNLKEAGEATGISGDGPADVKKMARILIGRLGCKYVLITRGEKGMSLFDSALRETYIPSLAKRVYDVTGAGDTVISVFSLVLGAGAGEKMAAYISNQAAGLVVGEVGTVTVSPSALKEAARDMGFPGIEG